ncbi:MAG: hypothetical protein V7672_00830 [Brevundimonas sp.]|uniref:DUF7227 family protein n=1 Tax=Brevundimonas sp. TaxID=1871086 RepID=UPI00300376B4
MTRSTVTRFEAREIEPDRVVPLPADHPALSEGRTIFGKTVTASKASPRFLITGHSNTKLGKEVLKGPLKGAAIFQLSLEERATCPRSCLQWAGCYGNSMPFARRHTPDADFERYLEAEVITLCRQHPDGLLIRLHVLGDFYSVEYVYLWARLIAEFPQLHVFGYTARTIYDEDPEGVRIARAIETLTDGIWGRFAIRTSSDLPDVADSRAIVVDEDPGLPDVIVCPAQTDDTAACATCGLCWSKGARDKTIAFLRHGRKLRGSGKPKPANDDAPVADQLPRIAPTRWPEKLGPRAQQLYDFFLDAVPKTRRPDGGLMVPFGEIADRTGIPHGTVPAAFYELEKRGLVEKRKDGRRAVYFLPSDAKGPAAETPAPARQPSPAPANPVALVPAPPPPSTKVTPKPVRSISLDEVGQGPKDARPRSLMARKPGQCAWPINDPGQGQMDQTTYCCDPVVGRGQYCRAHFERMFSGSRKPSAEARA